MTNFDPNSIPKYSVIALPHKFEGDGYANRKLFVVLGHKKEHALCLKATSRVEIYKNNKEAMAGVVYYHKGEIAAFRQDTAIQIDNCFAIPHRQLSDAHNNGSLEIRQTLRDAFEDRLERAIDNSVTLDDRMRKRLRQILEFPR